MEFTELIRPIAGFVERGMQPAPAADAAALDRPRASAG